MKLLLENWRNYLKEERLQERRFNSPSQLNEGPAFRWLKDKFVDTIETLARLGGGETQLQKAMSDFIVAYRDMFSANTIGGDKYFHCVANCMATDRGWIGKGFAVVFSELREFTDEYMKGEPWAACDADMLANMVGQTGAGRCADRCDDYIVPGLDCRFIDKYSGKDDETPT